MAVAYTVSVSRDPYRPLGLHTSTLSAIGALHDGIQRYLPAHGAWCDGTYSGNSRANLSPGHQRTAYRGRRPHGQWLDAVIADCVSTFECQI